MRRLDELEIFVRVVERGTLTAAATALGLPLATVSRQLRALEARLGVQLLHRTTRRLSVTEAGRLFYERCSAALSTIEAAEAAAGSFRFEPSGTLRVLAPYAFGLVGLAPRLGEFRLRFPQIHLCLFLENQPLDLVEHGFDIAIRAGPVPDSSYTMRLLRPFVTQLVASPAYLDHAGRPQTPVEIDQHPLLAIATDIRPVRWGLKGPKGAAEITGAPIFAANDATLVRQLAINGAGIALLSEPTIRAAVAEGTLEVVLPEWSRQEDTQFVILYPRRATTDRKVKAFVDYMLEVLGPTAARQST
jgi:DNA-binding transcriptional LysR family regulator